MEIEGAKLVLPSFSKCLATGISFWRILSELNELGHNSSSVKKKTIYQVPQFHPIRLYGIVNVNLEPPYLLFPVDQVWLKGMPEHGLRAAY